MGLSNTRRIEKQLETSFFEIQRATRDYIYEFDFKRWFKVMLEDCIPFENYTELLALALKIKKSPQ